MNTDKSMANRQKGQSILESVLCMLILCLILFGLLQVFHLAVAQLVTDYSAFYTARSYAVGFAPYLTDRSAKVASIAASGQLIEPDDQSFSSLSDQFAYEEIAVPEYIQGNRWLEYEYWYGGNEAYDQPYYNPSVSAQNTFLNSGTSEIASGTVKSDTYFTHYPFLFFDLMDKDRIWFGAPDSRTVEGEAEIYNHAASYLK